MFRKNHISMNALTLSTRQMAIMLQARLPVLKILEILKNQASNQSISELYITTESYLKRGYSLNKAMCQSSSQLPAYYINLIRIGEITGHLDTVFNELAGYLETYLNFRKILIQALTYPVLVLLISIIVIGFLLIVIIPSFQSVYDSLGAELPIITRLILGISHFTTRNGLVFLVIIPIIFLLLHYFSKSGAIKSLFRQTLILIPGIKNIFITTQLIQICRSMNLLLKNGIPVLESLEMTEKSLTESPFCWELHQIRQRIQTGKSFTESLTYTALFPLMLKQMVEVGENTSTLDSVFKKVSDYYETGLQNKLSLMSTLLEPIIILIIGFLIGGILIALYLPIFKMGQFIS